MILVKFKYEYFEDVVDMFYSFMKEVMHTRKIQAKYFFYKEVIEWIRQGYHIVIAEDKGVVVGFSMCRTDNMNNLTEDVYVCDYCYVKEDYRKTKAAHMMFNNSYKFAKENNYIVSVNGRIENGVSEMIGKHFGLKPKFTIFEGEK